MSLVDRSGLAKPLLIRRSFLRGRLLVDLKDRYLLEPACKDLYRSVTGAPAEELRYKSTFA